MKSGRRTAETSVLTADVTNSGNVKSLITGYAIYVPPRVSYINLTEMVLISRIPVICAGVNDRLIKLLNDIVIGDDRSMGSLIRIGDLSSARARHTISVDGIAPVTIYIAPVGTFNNL